MHERMNNAHYYKKTAQQQRFVFGNMEYTADSFLGGLNEANERN